MSEQQETSQGRQITLESGDPPDRGEAAHEREFPSSSALVTAQVVRIIELLVAEGFIEESKKNQVAVCFQEGLWNAVVHGNRESFSTPVSLRIFDDGDEWHAQIDDRGDGFTSAVLNEPVEDSEWGQSGRGLRIMSLYAKRVAYYRDGRTLVLTFERSGKRRQDPAESGDTATEKSP